MSVSSITSGPIAAQDGARNGAAQRIEARQPGQAHELPGQSDARSNATAANSSVDVQARTSLAMPTPHANRVGVAAYIAILNPAPAVSVRTEA